MLPLACWLKTALLADGVSPLFLMGSPSQDTIGVYPVTLSLLGDDFGWGVSCDQRTYESATALKTRNTLGKKRLVRIN